MFAITNQQRYSKEELIWKMRFAGVFNNKKQGKQYNKYKEKAIPMDGHH